MKKMYYNNTEAQLSDNDLRKIEKYISGEECICCKKSQKECKCTDEEIEQATEKIN